VVIVWRLSPKWPAPSDLLSICTSPAWQFYLSCFGIIHSIAARQLTLRSQIHGLTDFYTGSKRPLMLQNIAAEVVRVVLHIVSQTRYQATRENGC
jgi:hypothetical protein